MAWNCSQQPPDAADVVYTNGKIYTVSEAQPWAEAVAIKDGKFLAVGSNADVKATAEESTRVVDLGGKFVMPGIVDMHAHPFTGVDMGIGGINFTKPGDPEAMLAAVERFVAESPDRDVFLGGNWNVGGILQNDSPDKKLLDEIVTRCTSLPPEPERPLGLGELKGSRVGGHR